MALGLDNMVEREKEWVARCSWLALGPCACTRGSRWPHTPLARPVLHGCISTAPNPRARAHPPTHPPTAARHDRCRQQRVAVRAVKPVQSRKGGRPRAEPSRRSDRLCSLPAPDYGVDLDQ